LWGILAGLVMAALLIGAFLLGMLFGHPVINQYRTTNNYYKTVTIDKSVRTSTVTSQPAPVNVTETVVTVTVMVSDNDKSVVNPPHKERKHCKTRIVTSQSDFYSRTKRMRLPSHTVQWHSHPTRTSRHRNQIPIRHPQVVARGETYGLKFVRH